MKTKPLSITVALTVTLSVVLGCDSDGSGTTGVPSADGPSAPIIPSQPTLLMPINGALIPQNDPTTGCPFDPAGGHGHRIVFDWTDAQARNGIAGYELVCARSSVENPLPIIETFVEVSELTQASCGFIIDRNLDNWVWRVRAMDTQSVFGEWSEVGVFGFEPCRLDDGGVCWAPP